MKKLLAILMAAMMVFAVCACQDTTTPPAGNDDVNTETPDLGEENAETPDDTADNVIVMATNAYFKPYEFYEGDKIEAGKKNMVYSLTYQAMDRTLTDDEVNKAHNKLRDKLVANGDIVLR